MLKTSKPANPASRPRSMSSLGVDLYKLGFPRGSLPASTPSARSQCEGVHINPIRLFVCVGCPLEVDQFARCQVLQGVTAGTDRRGFDSNLLGG